MTLEEFASKHRLRVTRQDAENIIVGSLGHIYEHGDGERLGLLFMPPEEQATVKRWNSVRRRLEALGFCIWQDGDFEGSALFDPTNNAQVRLTLKVLGVKRKRRARQTDLANLLKTPHSKAPAALETTNSAHTKES